MLKQIGLCTVLFVLATNWFSTSKQARSFILTGLKSKIVYRDLESQEIHKFKLSYIHVYCTNGKQTIGNSRIVRVAVSLHRYLSNLPWDRSDFGIKKAHNLQFCTLYDADSWISNFIAFIIYTFNQDLKKTSCETILGQITNLNGGPLIELNRQSEILFIWLL